MDAAAERQYPPSSPPIPATRSRRALLPSLEPTPSPTSRSPRFLLTPGSSRKRVREEEDSLLESPTKEAGYRRLLKKESCLCSSLTSNIPPLKTFYPTPAPTSSASQNASSPTRISQSQIVSKNANKHSAISSGTNMTRSPLSQVALARLLRNGKAVTLGRSSISSTVVLSRINKLISRVHVATRYIPERDAIEVRCLGWNGARVGTPSKEFALSRGEWVEIPADTNVIVDVCGERARVEVAMEVDGDETDDEIFSQDKQAVSAASSGPSELQSSMDFKIWDDELAPKCCESSPGNFESSQQLLLHQKAQDTASFFPATSKLIPTQQQIQELDNRQPKKDRLEGNDFLEEITTERMSTQPKDDPLSDLNKLKTHIIAHLAYSRLASTPLSVLQDSVPTATSLPTEVFQSIVKNILCVGVIHRQGKDASGKRLEEQYYYIADKDEDEHRKAAVEDLRGHPGIRSCRKVHKQYFWRKPALK
ncbi:hypothetical protein V1511DRAFT_489876 [Dipodascopsis uninucleata]